MPCLSARPARARLLLRDRRLGRHAARRRGVVADTARAGHRPRRGDSV